jgi:hypothetical protein
VGAFARLAALDKIAVIMAAKGGVPAGITVGDCTELLDIIAAARTGDDGHAHSPLFYQLLRSWGAFGPDAPAALRALASRGQPTCEQLIDRYHIACQPVCGAAFGMPMSGALGVPMVGDEIAPPGKPGGAIWSAGCRLCRRGAGVSR